MISAVEVAQDLGVGFKLGREERAQLGKRRGGVEMAGVGGFVVDDPPGVLAFRLGDEAGAEYAVHAYVGEGAGNDSGPADFAGGAGVGRENPLGNGVQRGVERELERIGGDLGGVQ